MTKAQKLKLQIEFYATQGGKCYWCEKQLWPPGHDPQTKAKAEGHPNSITVPLGQENWGYAVLDHIIPKSRDGKDTRDNLTLSCSQCNREKNNKIWIKKDKKVLELKEDILPFKRRQRNIAHLWADKKVLRYFRKKYKKTDYRNLRNIYLALCEIESDFIEQLKEGQEGIRGFVKTLQTYSGLKYDTVSKYLKILKDVGGLEVQQVKEKGVFTDRSRVIMYAFPFSEKIRSRMKSEHKNTKVIIINKNLIKERELSAKADSPPLIENSKNIEVKEVIEFFYDTCFNIKGWKPQIAPSIEVPMIKRYLKNYKVEDLTDQLSWFLNSDESKKLGCTIKVSLSAFVFNKWLAQRETYH